MKMRGLDRPQELFIAEILRVSPGSKRNRLRTPHPLLQRAPLQSLIGTGRSQQFIPVLSIHTLPKKEDYRSNPLFRFVYLSNSSNSSSSSRTLPSSRLFCSSASLALFCSFLNLHFQRNQFVFQIIHLLVFLLQILFKNPPPASLALK